MRKTRYANLTSGIIAVVGTTIFLIGFALHMDIPGWLFPTIFASAVINITTFILIYGVCDGTN